MQTAASLRLYPKRFSVAPHILARRESKRTLCGEKRYPVYPGRAMLDLARVARWVANPERYPRSLCADCYVRWREREDARQQKIRTTLGL